MEKNFTIFFKNGYRAIPYYLTRDEAMALGKKFEDDGYKIMVSFHTERTNRWFNIYETR